MVMSDGSPLNAGHFYVPLPNTNIEIRNNLIVLRKPSIGSLAKPNIDKLLVSLAADKHSQTITSSIFKQQQKLF